MIDVSSFLESVAIHGFTKACTLHKISRQKEKDMCDYIVENSTYTITPYTTKQQIIYYYLALQTKTLISQE
jgi:hypothetical protein